MKEAIDIVEEINASIHFVRDTMLIISFTPQKIVFECIFNRNNRKELIKFLLNSYCHHYRQLKRY
jgi:hypothetical protein